jgi:hypothetical protein
MKLELKLRQNIDEEVKDKLLEIQEEERAKAQTVID